MRRQTATRTLEGCDAEAFSGRVSLVSEAWSFEVEQVRSVNAGAGHSGMGVILAIWHVMRTP